MTMSPDHIDLYRMADRLDPDQARCVPSRNSCYACTGRQDASEAVVPAAESLLADDQCGTSPSSGCSTVRRILPTVLPA